MTVQNSSATDTMTLLFINPGSPTEILGTIVSTVPSSNAIDNYTEISLEKDFFVPSNALSITIASNNLTQITQFVQLGFQVIVKINQNQQMVGYVFDYHLRSSRHGGTELTIHIKDLLEYMAQGSVPPNLGNGPNRFQFKAADTLNSALTLLANVFAITTGQPAITIETDNSSSLTFASGFNTGVKVPIKSIYAANRSKSLSTALGHLETPLRGGESYLAYMLRLAKHVGCNLKMSDKDPNVIFCKPPIYDRVTLPIFGIRHRLTGPETQSNNAHSVEYYFNADNQPSVVIMEANTTGDGKSYQTITKGVAINELTGYPPPTSHASYVTINGIQTGAVASQFDAPVGALIGVNNAIYTSTAGVLGTGWYASPFNKDLYDARGALPVDLYTQTALPHYSIDPNAHTSGIAGEVCYSAAKYLAECQDKYIEMVYHVDGWTYTNGYGNQYVWQPDMMVIVSEEAFTPGKPAIFMMWIRRVRFTKNRNGGTETEVHCTLPYTHNFEITP